MRKVIRSLAAGLVLSAVAVDGASAATCCVADANVCSAAHCEIPNVGGNCPIQAYGQDCGAPHYCTFDSDAGCQTTNPCTAAKFKAVAEVAQRIVRCDFVADVKGVAVDPGCTNKELAKLTRTFAQAEAHGACPGSVASLQNDITAFVSNLNTATGNAGTPRAVSSCDAQKVKAMGKMAAGFLTAMATAARTAGSPFLGILNTDSRAFNAMQLSKRIGRSCTNRSDRNSLQDDAVQPFVTAVSHDLAVP